ncbi:MAG: alpha/beta hydrolase [Pseudomonadota bacterium]
MPMAPEYQALLEQLAANPGPALTELAPSDARAVYRMMRPPLAELAVGRIGDRSCTSADGSTVPLRIYWPGNTGPTGVLVFFHGGGWVIGDLETADGVCRMICREAKCVVVSVDYRLAPEHPFPAAVEDCWAAVQWCGEHQAALGGNGRLAVGGESAGGNLAAVTALRARDSGGPALALQFLAYPVVDCDFSYPSYSENGTGKMLETATMAWFWNHYLADSNARSVADASPLRANNHGSLAPAFVLTAEFDPLRDEGAAYAAALEAAGTRAHYHCAPGLLHDFLSMGTSFKAVQPVLSLACTRIKEALNA